MSSPAVRRAKLLAHVDEPLDEVGIFVLYLIMAHHRFDPEELRKTLFDFMVRENIASNISLCFVGRSKSGKSRFIEGFEELLNGRSYEIQKNTAYSYAAFNDKTIDFCYINELRDKLRSGTITPDEVGDYWGDTGKFNQFAYCDECPSHLPFLSNSQNLDLVSKTGDKTSMATVHTRLAPIFMSGGCLPKDITWEHSWKITGRALSQFLGGKTVTPPWFEEHSSRMQYAVDCRAKLTANVFDKAHKDHLYEQYDIAISNMYKVHHPRMFTGEFVPHVRIKPRAVQPLQFDMGNLMQDSATLKRKIDEVDHDLDIDGTL